MSIASLVGTAKADFMEKLMIARREMCHDDIEFIDLLSTNESESVIRDTALYVVGRFKYAVTEANRNMVAAAEMVVFSE